MSPTPGVEQFTPLVGQVFALGDDMAAPSLTLTSASPIASPGALARPAFSLLFRGAGPGELPQSTYTLAHATLGSLAVFLVPLGPDGQGMLYEAIFN